MPCSLQKRNSVPAQPRFRSRTRPCPGMSSVGAISPEDTGRSYASTLRDAAASGPDHRRRSLTIHTRSRSITRGPQRCVAYPAHAALDRRATRRASRAATRASAARPPHSRNPVDPAAPSGASDRARERASRRVSGSAARCAVRPRRRARAVDRGCCRSPHRRGARTFSDGSSIPLRRAVPRSAARSSASTPPPAPAARGRGTAALRRRRLLGSGLDERDPLLLRQHLNAASTTPRAPDRRRRPAPAAAGNRRPRENADAAAGSSDLTPLRRLNRGCSISSSRIGTAKRRGIETRACCAFSTASQACMSSARSGAGPACPLVQLPQHGAPQQDREQERRRDRLVRDDARIGVRQSALEHLPRIGVRRQLEGRGGQREQMLEQSVFLQELERSWRRNPRETASAPHRTAAPAARRRADSPAGGSALRYRGRW